MEVLLVIIVIGTLLLLAVRISTRKRDKADTEEIRRATDVMKKELERTGNTIITRIGTHINKLERLLTAAQTENNRLLSGADEATSLRDSLQKLIAEARAVSEQLAEQQRALRFYQTMPPYGNAAPPIVVPPPPVADNNATRPAAVSSFDSLLKNSLQQQTVSDDDYDEYDDNVNLPTEKTAVPLAHLAQDTARQSPPINNDDDDNEYDEEGYDTDDDDDDDNTVNLIGNDSDARRRAQNLLAKGYGIDETARETGLGRGAVALMKKMIKR